MRDPRPLHSERPFEVYHFYARTKLDGIETVGNGDDADPSAGIATLNLEFDLGRVELTGGYQFGPAPA